MYNTSLAYRQAIARKLIKSRIVLTITTTNNETLIINDSKIVPNSVSTTNKASKNNSFGYGSAYVGEFKASILNADNAIDRYSLYGAKVVPVFYQTLTNNAEETIPMGEFYVSEAKRTQKIIALTCYDAMTRFDVPQVVDTFGTPFELLELLCNTCGVPLGVTQEEVEDMPNGTEQLSMSAERVSSCRDAIAYISTVLCGFATINRNGALEVRQFGTAAVDTIPASRRTSSTIADYQTYFLGIKARFIQSGNWIKVTANVSGRESGLVLDLGDLPVVQGVNETLQRIAQNIANVLGNVNFTPTDVSITGDASLDIGDVVTYTGVNNTSDSVTTIVTSLSWKYHGVSRLAGEGGNARMNAVTDYQTKQVATLETDMSVNEYAMKQYTNASQFNFSSTDETIITLNYSVNKDTTTVFLATIPIYMSLDGEAIFGYHLNNEVVEEVKVYLERGWHAVTLTNYFTNAGQSQNRLTVTCRTAYFESDKRIQDAEIAGLIEAVESGEYVIGEIDTRIPSATILVNTIKAVIFASGINTSESWDGSLLLIEEIGAIVLGNSGITVKPIEDIPVVATNSNNGSTEFTEQIAAVTLGNSTITVRQIAEAINMGRKVLFLTIDTTHAIEYAYNHRFVTIVNNGFTLNESYPSPSEYVAIDDGALKKCDCDVTGVTPSSMTIIASGEGGSGRHRLPAAYQEVEYIDTSSTGRCYINTGYMPTENTRIVADMQETVTNNYPRLFANGSLTGYGNVVMEFENGTLYVKFGAAASYTVTNVRRDMARHEYEIDGNVCYIDGTLITQVSAGTFTPSAYLGIFAVSSTASQIDCFKGKLFSFKMYENGVAVRNYVPCYRISDSTIGLYDTVNEEFVTNTGYGTLTKGPDVYDSAAYKTLVTDGTDVYSISNGALTTSVGLLANLDAQMFEDYGFDDLQDCVVAKSDLFALGEFSILRWCDDETETTSSMLVTILGTPTSSQDITTPIFSITGSNVTGIELTTTDSDGNPQVAVKFDGGDWEYYDFTDEMWEEVGTGTIGHMTIADLESLTEEIWAEKFETASTMQTKLTLTGVNDTITLVQYKFLQEEE